MAIFDWKLKTISRSEGRSAIAAAAYRAGVYLLDDRTGLGHDFSKRLGIRTEMILPAGVAFPVLVTPSWAQETRARLWNAAKAAERRINSVVAREILLAFPHELEEADRTALGQRYAQWIADRYRVAVDAAWHPPSLAGDQRNYHVHLLVTTREIGDGFTFGLKTRVLDAAATGGREISTMREEWAAQANTALAAVGVAARIDHRSLAARGLDREPGEHLGPKRSNMIRAGEKRLATIMAEIAALNAEIDALKALKRLELEQEQSRHLGMVIIDERELGPIGPYVTQAASPAGQRRAPPAPEPEITPVVTGQTRRKRPPKATANELEAAVGEAIMAEVEQRNAAHAAAKATKKRKAEEAEVEKRKLARRPKPLTLPQAAKVRPDDTSPSYSSGRRRMGGERSLTH